VARSHDDTWDITESVGSTALGVAAARAAETDSDKPLIRDPYAKLFLDAAGDGVWNAFAFNAPAEELASIDPELPMRMRVMVDYVASRTAFFDDVFISAGDEGVRQAAILAAGLDARAWRLPWPAGSVVYELDQPKVLEFKTATLEARSVRPAARLVNVAVDLRHDWPQALRRAGHDPAAPTTWSAEGLLPFLPAAAQQLLFERVAELSAPGSRIAVEAPSADFLDAENIERQQKLMARYREAAAKLHQRDLPTVADLWYFEEREDVGDWLRDHGWDVSVTTARDLIAGHHRTSADEFPDAVPRSLFVYAQRRLPVTKQG
jgi:methyltransferase (TIGR00027 family)